jgi:uncharacterized membrane protein YgcG
MKPAVRIDAYEQGVKDERERIIKLLEWQTRPEKLTELLQSLEHGEIRHEYVVLEIIAFIKGTNNA